MALLPRKKASADKKVAEEPKKNVASGKAAQYAHVLTSPRVSEKASVLAHTGVFVFNVPISSNKVEVRKAVEALYGVNVVAVNMARGLGKPSLRGRIAGRRSNWKKAFVQLKPGQKIDLIDGV